MQRYIAVLSNDTDAGSVNALEKLTMPTLRARNEWRFVMRVPGLLVACLQTNSAGSREYELPANRGVIFGQLFSARPSIKDTADNLARCSAEIVESGGKHLRDSYWGAYVAFLNDDRRRVKHILRDCSGKLPCYVVRSQGLQIVLSDIRDLELIRGTDLSIDWSYLSAFIFHDILRVRRTPLNEVTELLAGDRLTMSSSGTEIDSFWNPADTCSKGWIADESVAISDLREVTQRCISDWGGVFSRIALSLSGGFDSSVVLGYLGKAYPRSPEVLCINRFIERAGEDERKFARIAAARAGVTLVEKHWSAAQTELGPWIESAHVAVKPSVSDLINVLDVGFLSDWAEANKIEAIWTGQGGDHLFFQQHTPLTVADYVDTQGIGLLLPSLIGDAARISGESFWSVIRKTVDTLRFRVPWSTEAHAHLKPIFINPDSLPSDIFNYIAHPWSDLITHLPKGKQLHVLSIADLVNRHLPVSGVERVEHHHPLISQPLIELSLRIPTYLLLRTGRPRALARIAFGEDLPREIVERESKGESTSHIMNRVRHGRAYIRELLLDGLLVHQSILERTSIEKYLRDEGPIRSELLLQLLAAISAETWARHWHRKAVAVAA